MLSDARRVPRGAIVEPDLCIIGAGAAGITLARALEGSDLRILVLESGGRGFEEATADLQRGENVGLPYFPLDACRLRYFGGSTNHWTGYSRPLGEPDFEVRDWVPDSGWPFSRSSLDPYYTRAHEILELGPLGFETEPWSGRGGGPPLPTSGDVLRTELFQLSPPTRFAARYGPELEASAQTEVLLHANVTRIALDESGRRVDTLEVATLSGNAFTVKPRRTVLATGGIENARVLLASRGPSHPSGIGNERDLVGRYFMEHPHVSLATFLPVDADLDARLYELQSSDAGHYWGTLAVSDDVLRREKLCGISIGLVREARRSEEFLAATTSAGRASLDELLAGWKAGELPDDFGSHVWRVVSNLGDVSTSLSSSAAEPEPGSMFLVWLRTEQAPNRDSRVTLADEADALGVPRAQLDWQLSEIDWRTIEAAHTLLGRELGRSGLGRLFVPGGGDAPDWRGGLTGGNHHMGTTRMHDDPEHGVVDPDGRVHGVDDLWIAGSSVFPTAGYANPTLTIVALTLRLADQLRKEAAA